MSCLIWDTKLTFEPHFKYLKRWCQKSLNILKVFFCTEWGTDQITLLKSYRYSLIESLYFETHEPPWEILREKLALHYTLKSKNNPGNPAYDVVFHPKYQNPDTDKDSATDFFGIHCKKLLKESKVDVAKNCYESLPDLPLWDSEPVTVDFTLSEFDKSSTSSTVFRSRFNELRQKYLDFCHIYTDGSKVERK